MRHYVKLAKDPTFWLVEDGKRRVISSQAEMLSVGILPVKKVTAEELEAIPLWDESEPEPEPPHEEEIEK